MIASDCRSAWKRCTTVSSYIPALISFKATGRRTGAVCSASHTCPMPPSPSLRISWKRSAKSCPSAKPAAPNPSPSPPNFAGDGDSRNPVFSSSPTDSSDSSSTRSAAFDAQTSSSNLARASGSKARAWCSSSLTCAQLGRLTAKRLGSFPDATRVVVRPTPQLLIDHRRHWIQRFWVTLDPLLQQPSNLTRIFPHRASLALVALSIQTIRARHPRQSPTSHRRAMRVLAAYYVGIAFANLALPCAQRELRHQIAPGEVTVGSTL